VDACRQTADRRWLRVQQASLNPTIECLSQDSSVPARLGGRPQGRLHVVARGARSDPLVIIDTTLQDRCAERPGVLRWLLARERWCRLDLTVATDPPLGAAGDPIKGSTRAAGVPASVSCGELGSAPYVRLPAGVSGGKAGQFWLVVRYRDLWSCDGNRVGGSMCGSTLCPFPIEYREGTHCSSRAVPSSTPNSTTAL